MFSIRRCLLFVKSLLFRLFGKQFLINLKEVAFEEKEKLKVSLSDYVNISFVLSPDR